jgi:hypothetical protein
MNVTLNKSCFLLADSFDCVTVDLPIFAENAKMRVYSEGGVTVAVALPGAVDPRIATPFVQLALEALPEPNTVVIPNHQGTGTLQ